MQTDYPLEGDVFYDDDLKKGFIYSLGKWEPMEKKKVLKDCICHTCNKEFNHLGIARHRAMHRDRKEICEITYSDGSRFRHNTIVGTVLQK